MSKTLASPNSGPSNLHNPPMFPKVCVWKWAPNPEEKSFIKKWWADFDNSRARLTPGLPSRGRGGTGEATRGHGGRLRDVTGEKLVEKWIPIPLFLEKEMGWLILMYTLEMGWLITLYSLVNTCELLLNLQKRYVAPKGLYFRSKLIEPPTN